jgi:NTP pyrophosphatase (non-canonical NTP hydrolase)
MNRLEHLLTILCEECNELSQATTKALRFGVNEQRDLPTSNLERMQAELNDLAAMIEMLQDEGLDLNISGVAKALKRRKVEQYLLYSKECGTLTP